MNEIMGPSNRPIESVIPTTQPDTARVEDAEGEDSESHQEDIQALLAISDLY